MVTLDTPRRDLARRAFETLLPRRLESEVHTSVSRVVTATTRPAFDGGYEYYHPVGLIRVPLEDAVTSPFMDA